MMVSTCSVDDSQDKGCHASGRRGNERKIGQYVKGFGAGISLKAAGAGVFQGARVATTITNKNLSYLNEPS